jgi:hypothetical protein
MLLSALADDLHCCCCPLPLLLLLPSNPLAFHNLMHTLPKLQTKTLLQNQA